MATLAARLSSGMLAPDAALRRRLLLCGQLLLSDRKTDCGLVTVSPALLLRLVGSAVLFPVVHDTFPRCFANSPPITRLRDCPTRRKCASSSIPLLLASSIDPADSEGLLKILGVGEGPRLAYIGTARTAPRKDSERPLKDQRKKRRYEARHRSKLLGEALGASSVENIFLEDSARRDRNHQGMSRVSLLVHSAGYGKGFRSRQLGPHWDSDRCLLFSDWQPIIVAFSWAPLGLCMLAPKARAKLMQADFLFAFSISTIIIIAIIFAIVNKYYYYDDDYCYYKGIQQGARQLSNALKIALGNDARGILFVDGGNTFWLLGLRHKMGQP